MQGCLWDQCFKFWLVFIAMQTLSYSLLLILHFLKVKFCCKRSVPIEGVDDDQGRENEVAYDNLLNTASKKN